jgi:threonine dehydrogenase-like Zn-dependent dehydrogenase
VTTLAHCLTIPEDIPSRRALFAPSMESALSFVMDAAPMVGERVLVFGQGVVGLLTTAVLAQFPLGGLTGVDPMASRRERSLLWGAGDILDPVNAEAWVALQRALFSGNRHEGADLCFELSGNLDALNQAIALTGFAGRILVGSWYGTADRQIDLGGPFHRRRIGLIASQVSTLSPALTGRWDKPRRMAMVWDWLRRLSPETLITHEFKPEECQQAFEVCSRRLDSALQVIFRYSLT